MEIFSYENLEPYNVWCKAPYPVVGHLLVVATQEMDLSHGCLQVKFYKAVERMNILNDS